MLAEASLLTFNGTIVVQAVVFIIVAILLWRYAWGPLTAQIYKRNERIEAGVRAAAEAERRLTEVQTEVQKLLDEAKAQAREILVRAHQEATADADAVRNNARHEAEAIVARAHAEIEAERDRALQELRAQVSALVVEAAARVLGQAIDAKSHERLIEETLASVSSRS